MRRLVVELVGVEVVEQHVDVRAELAQRLAEIVGHGGGEAVEITVRLAQPARVGDQMIVVARPRQCVTDELRDRLDQLPALRRELDRLHPSVDDDAEQLAAFVHRQHRQRRPVQPLQLLDEARIVLAQLLQAGDEDRLPRADCLGSWRRIGEVDDAHGPGTCRRSVVDDELAP